MILLLDNYDSFTYNLFQYLEGLGQKVKVIRNDQTTVAKIKKMAPTHIVISPGPGRPENAGIALDIIKELGGQIPILGVCLGHQAIGMAFGGKVIKAKRLMHGKTSEIHHDQKGIYKGINQPFIATRYHSLIVEAESLPKDLKVTAKTEDGIIMGVQHKKYPIYGMQYHPESIMTEQGQQLLANFIGD